MPIFAISSLNKFGIKELKYQIWEWLKEHRQKRVVYES